MKNMDPHGRVPFHSDTLRHAGRGVLFALLAMTMLLVGCSQPGARKAGEGYPGPHVDAEFERISLHLKVGEHNRVEWHVNEVATTDKQIVLKILQSYHSIKPSASVEISIGRHVHPAMLERARSIVRRAGFSPTNPGADSAGQQPAGERSK